MIYLSIAKHFTESPGGRYEKEGRFSGENFRDNQLIPKYLEAKNADVILQIDLDGTYGYATSFLDEAFGGLAEAFGKKDVLERLDFISYDQPGLVDQIRKYIEKR